MGDGGSKAPPIPQGFLPLPRQTFCGDDGCSMPREESGVGAREGPVLFGRSQGLEPGCGAAEIRQTGIDRAGVGASRLGRCARRRDDAGAAPQFARDRRRPARLGNVRPGGRGRQGRRWRRLQPAANRRGQGDDGRGAGGGLPTRGRLELAQHGDAGRRGVGLRRTVASDDGAPGRRRARRARRRRGHRPGRSPGPAAAGGRDAGDGAAVENESDAALRTGGAVASGPADRGGRRRAH